MTTRALQNPDPKYAVASLRQSKDWTDNDTDVWFIMQFVKASLQIWEHKSDSEIPEMCRLGTGMFLLCKEEFSTTRIKESSLVSEMKRTAPKQGLELDVGNSSSETEASFEINGHGPRGSTSENARNKRVDYESRSDTTRGDVRPSGGSESDGTESDEDMDIDVTPLNGGLYYSAGTGNSPLPTPL